MDRITKIVYINLRHREDRNTNILKQLDKINCKNFSRFDAIKTNFGGLGCCQSHISILDDFIKEYKDGNSKDELSIMILEDDAEFMVNRDILDKYINEFLDDKLAHGLSLGYYPHKVEKYNENFKRSIHVATTSGYIVKLSMVSNLLDTFRESELGLLVMEKNNLDMNSKEFRIEYNKYAIDQLWKKLHAKYLWLVPKKKCVEQYANYSDIEKKQITDRY